MRVLALHLTPNDEINACQIYRANLPLYYLASQGGHTTRWEHWFKIVEDFQKRGRAALTELADSADLFVLPRAAADSEAKFDTLSILIRLLHNHGRRVVYEVDDDFSNEHRDLRGMGIDRAMEIASLCDAVTVTTRYLADRMQRLTGRPAYALPNSLHPQLWGDPSRRLRHEGIVIGLTGSITHEADWRVLETVLPRILVTDYGFPVRLRMAGFHPDYLQNLPNTDYLPAFEYTQYAEIVRSCDIILAPVVPDDPFNLCKSPIKAVEGMGSSRLLKGRRAGAAVIATDNPVYRQAITSGDTGLLVEHTPDGWYQAIDGLLRNEAQRHTLQWSGYTSVWRRFDIRQTWRQWARAYQTIAALPALQAVS